MVYARRGNRQLVLPAFPEELRAWYRATSIELLAMNGLSTRAGQGNMRWLLLEALRAFRLEYERLKAAGESHQVIETPEWDVPNPRRVSGLTQNRNREEGNEDVRRLARERREYLGGVEDGVCCGGRSGGQGVARGTAVSDRAQQKVMRLGRGKR